VVYALYFDYGSQMTFTIVREYCYDTFDWFRLGPCLVALLCHVIDASHLAVSLAPSSVEDHDDKALKINYTRWIMYSFLYSLASVNVSILSGGNSLAVVSGIATSSFLIIVLNMAADGVMDQTLRSLLDATGIITPVLIFFTGVIHIALTDQRMDQWVSWAAMLTFLIASISLVFIGMSEPKTPVGTKELGYQSVTAVALVLLSVLSIIATTTDNQWVHNDRRSCASNCPSSAPSNPAPSPLVVLPIVPTPTRTSTYSGMAPIQPSASRTTSSSATKTATPSPTATPTQSLRGTAVQTTSPSGTPTPSMTETPSISQTPTESPTTSNTVSETPTPSPTIFATKTFNPNLIPEVSCFLPYIERSLIKYDIGATWGNYPQLASFGTYLGAYTYCLENKYDCLGITTISVSVFTAIARCAQPPCSRFANITIPMETSEMGSADFEELKCEYTRRNGTLTITGNSNIAYYGAPLGAGLTVAYDGTPAQVYGGIVQTRAAARATCVANPSICVGISGTSTSYRLYNRLITRHSDFYNRSRITTTVPQIGNVTELAP